MSYTSFIETKMHELPAISLSSPPVEIDQATFPFQRAITEWAIHKGRAAIWADTGLGKTRMQLEWTRNMGERTLILAPLAVAGQTVREGAKLGIDVIYARKQDDAGLITVTNYQMLSAFDPTAFGAVVLDESSILKSFDGKTRTRLIETFADTPYRLCCTATPAPNDLNEFGNHAEFLGVSTRRDMLATYFVHKDDGWHIKGHAVEPFYRWLASWAMMVKMPSDIGFDDDGYTLPPLRVHQQWVGADMTKVAQKSGRLFMVGMERGISGRSAARRATLDDKVAKAAALANADSAQWVFWCGLNDEATKLANLIPDAQNIRGSDSVEAKAHALQSFADGDLRVLVTKTSIGGYGLNLQNCHNMAFVGLNDSYEQWYQAIRRCWRYGQKEPVNVHVILSEAESAVLENVMRKEQQVERTSREMVSAIAGYEREELANDEPHMSRYRTDRAIGADWELLLGDCVERLNDLPEQSVDFSVFSPPFLNLYSYTASDRDMGNSKTDEGFYEHFNYFLDSMRRVMKPGRIIACHVAQVASTLVDDGVIGIKDFRGHVIEAFVNAGFVHHGEVCIDKDPQAQAIRTHSKALLFVQLKKDASWLRPAIPDYILLFRTPGANAVPVHPDINNEEWIEWARPIWYGIRESDTLNVAEARTEKDEKHIAPLQLGTIERCIRLWSNPGELVLSPFAGIGSEGYVAIKAMRRFVGVELKPEYYEVAKRNLRRATEVRTQGSLFEVS